MAERSNKQTTIAIIIAVSLGVLVAWAGSDGGDRVGGIKIRPVRFLVAWTLQGLWVLLTAATAFAIITGGVREPLGVVGIAGAAVWAAGMLIEIVADRQKTAFRANPENAGKFIRSGLWAWSRHPNYFGEIVLWSGVAIVAPPVLQGWQWVTLISPVFVFLLLTRVSGVPMLEAKATGAGVARTISRLTSAIRRCCSPGRPRDDVVGPALLSCVGEITRRFIEVAAVESQMLPLGTVAPGFTLPDPDGTLFALPEGAPATLVMFISNHCPFVQHIREELARLGSEYGSRGVAIFAINSNDVANYPADHPDRMKEEAARWSYTFPYLFDETQETAKAYRAACTPDFYLFDADMMLVYRGQLDGSRPGNNMPVNGRDLRAALDAVLAGEKPAADQRPSIGCNIKWMPGNAPDYF